MKKVLFILAAVLSVAAVSCNKGEKANKLEYTLNDQTYTYTDFTIVYNDDFDGCYIWVFKDPKDTVTGAKSMPIMALLLDGKNLLNKEVALNSNFGTTYPDNFFMIEVPDGNGSPVDFVAPMGEFISGSVSIAVDSVAHKLDINVKDAVAEGKETKANFGASLKANFRYSGPAHRNPDWGI